MTTSKGQVRSDFKYLRELMRQAEAIMKNDKNISDWREASDAGQIANAMTAAAGTFSAWIEESKGGMN